MLRAACYPERRRVQSAALTAAPPVSSSPRKFLESGNSYLTQEVIAQLLSDGRGSLWSSGDLRRPFIDKLPPRFYTVQCTPSAKEGESSPLQSPASLLHAPTLALTQVGRAERKRSESRETPGILDLPPRRFEPLLSLGCSTRAGRHAGRGWARRALAEALPSPG